MKKRLTKSHSAPDGLPRIPSRQHTANRRNEDDKTRHHSASGISPWGSNRDGKTTTITASLFPRQTITSPRSVLTPFPLIRASTFDKYSKKSFQQPMVTILQTEYENDSAPSLIQSDGHLSDCQFASDCTSDISSRSDLTLQQNIGLTHRNPNGGDTYVRSSQKSATGSIRPTEDQPPTVRTYFRTQATHCQQKQMKSKLFPPRTPPVSPIGARNHVPHGAVQADNLPMPEDLPLDIIHYSRDNLLAIDNRWEEETGSDDIPSVVTCPVLTQEMLSATAMKDHVVRKQGRVFDWLASCDDDIRTKSLPPYLPDISGLKRYNTTVA